jgi:chitinase
MGIPTYGHTWALSSSNTGYNAPASGPGAAGSATQTAGVLAYYEICLAIKNNGWTKATSTNGPYAYQGTWTGATWAGFDDATSATSKANFILSKGLGGAMFWDASMDDFGNYCGAGFNPIITAVSKTLGVSG